MTLLNIKFSRAQKGHVCGVTGCGKPAFIVQREAYSTEGRALGQHWSFLFLCWRHTPQYLKQYFKRTLEQATFDK